MSLDPDFSPDEQEEKARLISQVQAISLSKTTMTLCKYDCMIMSHDVSKILTACRILQISIAWCQIEAEIRSFPTMYGKGGG